MSTSSSPVLSAELVSPCKAHVIAVTTRDVTERLRDECLAHAIRPSVSTGRRSARVAAYPCESLSVMRIQIDRFEDRRLADARHHRKRSLDQFLWLHGGANWHLAWGLAGPRDPAAGHARVGQRGTRDPVKAQPPRAVTAPPCSHSPHRTLTNSARIHKFATCRNLVACRRTWG